MKQHQLIVVFDGQQKIAEKLQHAIPDLELPWRIESHDNLESAFQLLEVNLEQHSPSPDLILVDATLPNLAAFDFLYCAKKHSFFQDIPIILLGDNSDKDKRSICYHFHGNAFCKMPDTPAETYSLAKCLNDFWMITPQLETAVANQ
ncbi:MAG: hypothetical protein ACFHVJ_14440 [Aestuariibacter sp.]